MNLPSRRNLRLFVIGLLVLAGAVPALLGLGFPASAGTDVTLNLPRTGQTTCTGLDGSPVACAGTGHDGDHLAGLPWPAPRFIDNQDGTFTDLLTGLQWSQDAETPGIFVYSCAASNITVNWQQALDHVACLNSRNYRGHNDWRLPNINELESLVNSEVSDSAAWLQSQGFINVWGTYWSSTTELIPDFPNGEMAYQLNFLVGETRINFKTSTSYLGAVWPVRGTTGGVAPLWKTGQTTAYAAGDDGHLEAGVAWPEPRFTVSGECITDRLTGLMWPRNADRLNGLQGWQAALDHAATLTLCGFDDWRLPNRKEMWSLLNQEAADPAAWLVEQGFANVRNQPINGSSFPYWTSTSYAYNPVAAWGVRLDGGSIYAFMKDPFYGGYGYVWPVRSGSVGGVILPTDTPVPTPTNTPAPPTPTPLPRPVVQAVVPAEGQADTPGSLQVQGYNFKPGAVVELGGGLILSTTYQTGALLTAHLPGVPADVYDLQVHNPDGLSGIKSPGYIAHGPAVDDLYGYAYELVPVQQTLYAGQGTTLFFTVYRRGGAATLNNVKVSFYNGSPQSGGALLGSGTIIELRPNGFFAAKVDWTPPTAGNFTIYAQIDPQDQVPETDETNNLYANTLTVGGVPQPTPGAPAPDTTPPVINAFSGPLTVYTPAANFSLGAGDPGGAVAWMDFVVWELSILGGDWLVMDDTGWLPYQPSHRLEFWDWPGPRWVEVYVADRAGNISEPAAWVVNYIPPDDFLFEYESRLYLYPLLGGETLSAGLTPTWPDPDLYLWPPDYPTHNWWVSANDAWAPETLNVSVPLDGFYWLEAYAYADWPSFGLTVGVSAAANTTERLPDRLLEKPPRLEPPLEIDTLPSGQYWVGPLRVPLYLPVIRR